MANDFSVHCARTAIIIHYNVSAGLYPDIAVVTKKGEMQLTFLEKEPNSSTVCNFLIKNTCTKNQVSYLVLTYHIKKSNTLPLLANYLSFILLYLRDCLTFFSNHPCQRLLTRTFSFEEKNPLLFLDFTSQQGSCVKERTVLEFSNLMMSFFTKLPLLRFF